MAEGFRVAKAYVEVVPDTDGFDKKLQADLAKDKVEAKVKATPDTAEFKAKLKAAIDAVGEEKIRLGVDAAGVRRAVTEAKTIVEAFSEEEAKAKLGADKTDVDRKVDEAKAKVDELDGKHAHAKVELDDGGFKEAAAADSSAASGLGSHISLLGVAVAGLTMALPAVGGALGALGGAGMTVGLAFSGVKQALTDATAAQQAMGQSSAQVAATEYANSVAIRSAQQGIADAKRSAAQQAISSAESIASAQQSLGDAERSAANEAIMSAQSVANAEQSLANAQISEQMAQVALTTARRDAARQLEQLNNAEKDGKLSVEAATLSLQQAQLNAKQIDQSNVTTALQRAQADLAVEQAQQSLIEAQQKANNATQDANRANKQGVEGSPGVVSARNSERLALLGISGAQQSLANAQRAAANSQIASAEAMKNATRSLADAQRNAANSQISSHEAVRKAIQGLADTQKQQALQAQVTAASNAQAANKFARDMANMTQAGRDFVHQLLGMKTELHGLSATAQTAFLPGVTSFLQSTRSLMPTLNTEIQKMGGILGSQFTQLGNVVKSSGFRNELNAIFAQGNQLVSVLVPALGRMAGSFMHLLSVSGSASAGLTKGLSAIADGFGAMFKAMEPSAAAVGTILRVLGQAIGSLGAPIGQVISALAGALAPALAALLPSFKTLVSALGQGLAVALRGITPLLTLVAQAIGAIATGIAPVLPVLGQLIGQLAGALTVALKPLLPVIQTLAKTLGQELATVLPPLVGMFAQMIKATTPLFGLLGPIAKLVAGLAVQLSGVLAQAILQLTPTMVQLVSALVGLAVKVLPPLIPILQTQLIPAFVKMLAAIIPILPQITTFTNNLTILAIQALPILLPVVLKLTTFLVQLTVGVMGVVTWVAKLASGLIKLATSAQQSWSQMWAETKKTFTDIWNFLKRIWEVDIKGVFSSQFTWLKNTWRDTTDWVWNLWTGWLTSIGKRARTAWDDMRAGVTALWNDLKRLFQSGVSALGTVWSTLQDVFKKPVNFLINTVYTNGIRSLWNSVVDHIGMKNLDLPVMHGLNAGGIVPGPNVGGVVGGPNVNADVMPTLLTPGERVLSRPQVAMLGGHHAIDAMVGRSTGPSDASHFAGGGIVGGLIGGLKSIVGGAKWLTDFMLHPASSMTGLLNKVVSTTAQGDLGKMMTGIPIELIKDLAKYIATAGASGGAMAMINLAKTQVGTPESPPGSNSQRYSHELGRPSEAWCADFIDWLAKKTGNSGIIPQTASAPGMAQGFGSSFQSGSSGILPGDIVFYSGASNGFGGIGHVGIAVTGGNTWQSVEGNSGDHVALNTRSSAQGHARPKYPVTGGPGGSLIHASPSAAQAWAQQALMSYGWGNAGQYSSLVNLWNRESGWRWNATNPSSGAYGIPQSLPASKMGSAGGDWHDNAATQMRWGLGYIKGRYGSPAAAMAHENSAGWYDQGGYLPPGMSQVMNATGKPEAVLDPRQTAALERLADALTGMSGGGSPSAAVHQENHFHGSGMASPEELAALRIHLATAIGNS